MKNRMTGTTEYSSNKVILLKAREQTYKDFELDPSSTAEVWFAVQHVESIHQGFHGKPRLHLISGNRIQLDCTMAELFDLLRSAGT